MTQIENIPRTYLDWQFDEDERRNYRFVVVRNAHKLFPSSRVKLCVLGRPSHQFGTVVQVEDDGIIIHTDEWLDISEEYSIELIEY